MKKLLLASALVALGGCSSFGDKSEGVALMDDKIVEPVDAAVVVKDTVTIKKEDEVPEWYINLPKDTEVAIFGSGSGLSADLQFSMDKAMHQAKVILGDKLSNKVSMEMRSYISDNSSTGGRTVEDTKKLSKSGFKGVDVSAYTVVKKAVFKERSRFRAYVLLEIDPSDRPITVDTVTPVEIEKVRAESEEALNNL
ncbi:MAG: hypothetical protein ISQ26_10570 [Candidatus Puniceispirillum sp.]|nr:hypothetical protein [Candidatus Puniceispirillum sp.]